MLLKQLKAFLKAKKRIIIELPSRSHDLNPLERLFCYWRQKNHDQAAAEGGCSKGLTTDLSGGNAKSGDIHGL